MPGLPDIQSFLKKPLGFILIVFSILLVLLGLLIVILKSENKPQKKEATSSVTTSKVNPTGSLAQSIVGPIKEINSSSRQIVVLNTRDGKNYQILVSAETPIFEDNKQVGFEKLKVDLHVAVYSEKSFNGTGLNRDFSYITITGSPIPETKGDSKGSFPSIGGN